MCMVMEDNVTQCKAVGRWCSFNSFGRKEEALLISLCFFRTSFDCQSYDHLLSYQGCTGPGASPTCLQTDTCLEEWISAGNPGRSDNAQLPWFRISGDLFQRWRRFGPWAVDHMRLLEELRQVGSLIGADVWRCNCPTLPQEGVETIKEEL